MTKTSKKLTILVLIASLGLVVSGCVKKPVTNTNTNQPTNTNQVGEVDTSDWQTYRNEEYGFEFKYPEKYQITNGYSVWDTEGGAADLKAQWGVNKGQETIFSISVYPKQEMDYVLDYFDLKVVNKKIVINSDLTGEKLNNSRVLLKGDSYIYIIYSSFIDIPSSAEYSELINILNTLRIQ